MGLERKDINLEGILNTALQDPEIAKGISALDLGNDFFRREIDGRSEKIWSAASGELDHLAGVEADLARAETAFKDAAPAKSPLHRFLESDAPEVVYGLCGFVITVGGLVWLIWGLISGFGKVSSKLFTFPWPWVFGLVLIVWIGTAIFRTVSRRLYQRKYDRYAKGADLKLRTEELKEAVGQAKSVVENVLLERGVKSELRAIINAESKPNYSSKLSVRTAPGLAEVFDPAYEIPTESKDRVVRMLEDMPGGSIGIAGPRGAGKSTLIWSLCRGTISDLKGRPLFAMMTSAPVKYDGREFILHLFSTLCTLVLGGTSAQDFRTFDRDSRDPPNLTWRRISRGVVAASPVFWIVGSLLISGGLLLAFALAKAPAAPHEQNLSIVAAPSPTPAAQTNPSHDPSWLEILKASDLKPAPFLFLGFICLGFAVISPIARWLEMSRPSRKDPDPIPGATDRAIERVGRDVAKNASQLLREIRFQQSYSSGWSGSLKLPIGIEGSVNTAISLAERQRSLPEVVDAYRSFVKSLAAKHSVLIGIDELDKLESDETAQQFLNEIKSIFGLDHCYYLISVSENAISSFERRGLPFRDAFDSAFDSIIYVDYLTLDNAKRLLRRRVIGLEVPFMCLCYCLSGGLARDLIRSCRDMIERVRLATAATDLGSICEQMVTNDIRSKLRAIEVSLKRHRVEPELSLAIDHLRKIEDASVDRDTFLEVRRNLSAPRFVTEEMNGDATETRQKRRAISDLALELHTYLYFAATLLEFFTNNLSEQQLSEAERAGEITKLARAKQSFAVNAYTALSILDEFRSHNGLAVM
jgi:hypothetical protein